MGRCFLRGEPTGHPEGESFAAELINAVLHGAGWPDREFDHAGEAAAAGSPRLVKSKKNMTEGPRRYDR
jgi:hypothetical protein